MSPLERVRALVRAARRLSDARDPLGARARALLPASTGLSRENVELALTEILETSPSEDELAALVASVTPAPRARVSLAASVFTAPLRAIALALAQAPSVSVRASRREPEFCRLLHEAGGDFELVEKLVLAPGDHLWAYGTDATLHELAATLPGDVVMHAHGSGMGIAWVGGEFEDAAHALARDVVPFDQRGCLSPRLAFVPARELGRFADLVARALDDAETQVPMGLLSADEAADVTRWRDTAVLRGKVRRAGRGWVACDDGDDGWLVPPVGRNVCVLPAERAAVALPLLASSIAAVGVHGDDAIVCAALPHARRSALGAMQRPPLDGPVDLRPRTAPCSGGWLGLGRHFKEK